MCYRGVICGAIPCECDEMTAKEAPKPVYETSITKEQAQLVWTWVNERGGVAIWHSQDLGNLTSVQTPRLTAEQAAVARPGWQYRNVPDHVVTEPAKIEVFEAVPVCSVRIGIKRGSGLSMVLTDASSAKLKAALAKIGEGAYHVFDFNDKGQRVAVIKVPKTLGSLADYAKEQGWITELGN